MIYLVTQLNQFVLYLKFKHRLYKFLCPELFMSTQHLNYVNDTYEIVRSNFIL